MDRVILIDEKGRKRLVSVTEEVQKVSGLGVIDFTKFPKDFAGKSIEIAGKRFIALSPSILDFIDTIDREAQIITPKDSASIILNCDVKSGDSVLEVGIGSGAMTIVLAHFVFPSGRIMSYEKREDFAKIASKNIRNAGYSDIVEVKVKDASDGIEEIGFDSAIVDIPNPWDVIHHIYRSLKPGGHLAIYVPTVNQMERVVRKLRELPLHGIRSLETIQREMEVGEKGTRPSFEMLGHTGYLTFARKIVE